MLNKLVTPEVLQDPRHALRRAATPAVRRLSDLAHFSGSRGGSSSLAPACVAAPTSSASVDRPTSLSSASARVWLAPSSSTRAAGPRPHLPGARGGTLVLVSGHPRPRPRLPPSDNTRFATPFSSLHAV